MTKTKNLTRHEKAIVNQPAIALMRANAGKGYAILNGRFELPTIGAQFDYWAGLIDGGLWVRSPEIIIGEDRTKLARLIGGIVVQMPKPAGLQNVADEDYVGYLHEIYKKAFEYKD
jgi:hypothetical protein